MCGLEYQRERWAPVGAHLCSTKGRARLALAWSLGAPRQRRVRCERAAAKVDVPLVGEGRLVPLLVPKVAAVEARLLNNWVNNVVVAADADIGLRVDVAALEAALLERLVRVNVGAVVGSEATEASTTGTTGATVASATVTTGATSTTRGKAALIILSRGGEGVH